MIIISTVRFWLYLIFVIPSILFCIFNLYHFLVDRTLRKGLNNHVIILIIFLSLFYNITNIIWLIHYYRTGYSILFSPIFCVIWMYIDYAPYVSMTHLVSWASIERHILIFHRNFVLTRRKRLIVHYIPMIIFGIYPFVYYIIIIFILSCKIPIDYTKTRCGLTSCAYPNGIISMWDGFINNILPVFSIVIFSLALIIRVWYKKFRIKQRFHWRNYRKMTIQLLSISFIYFILIFPPVILFTAYSLGVSYNVGAEFYSGSMYFSYFVTILTPCVCTFTLPELREKFQKIFKIFQRTNRVVGPGRLSKNIFLGSRTDRVIYPVQ